MEAAQKNSGAKPGANKKKLNKGKSKKDKLPLQSGGPKGHPHAKETTFYQGYAAMCAGYFKLVVAMKEEGKIRVPGMSTLILTFKGQQFKGSTVIFLAKIRVSRCVQPDLGIRVTWERF